MSGFLLFINFISYNFMVLIKLKDMNNKLDDGLNIIPIQLKYVLPALKEQLPLKRLLRNFFITGNAWGMFSKSSHYTKKGAPKVGYNTLKTAKKSADAMQRKRGFYYSTYRCIRCGKFHLGRNRDSIKDGK